MTNPELARNTEAIEKLTEKVEKLTIELETFKATVKPKIDLLERIIFGIVSVFMGAVMVAIASGVIKT